MFTYGRRAIIIINPTALGAVSIIIVALSPLLRKLGTTTLHLGTYLSCVRAVGRTRDLYRMTTEERTPCKVDGGIRLYYLVVVYSLYTEITITWHTV